MLFGCDNITDDPRRVADTVNPQKHDPRVSVLQALTSLDEHRCN